MTRVLSNLVLTVVMAAFAVVMVWWFVRSAAPEPRVLPTKNVTDADVASILEGVTDTKLRASMQRFDEFGSRFVGSDGQRAAEAWIAKTLEQAGYEVMRQPVTVTVPVTKHATLTTVESSAARGQAFDIAPLLPNWLRTCTTPPQGITGTVLRGEQGLAREFEGKTVKGNFVLLPLGKPWEVVASMGAAAVIYYRDPDTPVGSNWDHFRKASLDVPRLLLEGDPDDLEGKTVTLRVRVDFEQVTANNVIGFLESDTPDADALILSTYYDAYSYAPDRAPGAGQSAGPIALAATAEQLATQQEHIKRSVVVVFTAGHAQSLEGMRAFAGTLGPRARRNEAVEKLRDDAEKAERDVALLRELAEVARDQTYWSAKSVADEDTYWSTRSPDAREMFVYLVKRVFDEDLLASAEAIEQNRLAWVRAGMPVPTDEMPTVESFDRYSASRADQRRIIAAQSRPLAELKADNAKLIGAIELPDRVRLEAEARVANLLEGAAKTRADLALAERLQRYPKLLGLSVDLSFGGQRLALVAGSKDGAIFNSTRPADGEVASQFALGTNQLQDALPDAPYRRTETDQRRFLNLVREADAKGLPFVPSAWGTGAGTYFQSLALLFNGHTSFTVATLDDGRSQFGSPEDTFETLLEDSEDAEKVLDGYTINVQQLAAATERIARGHGTFLPVSVQPSRLRIRGRIVTELGDSLVPNHPMGGAVVRFDGAPVAPTIGAPPGVARAMMLTADRDGYFTLDNIWERAITTNKWSRIITVDAALMDKPTGTINWTLLESVSGPDSPYAAHGVQLDRLEFGQITVVMFRCTPMQVFPMPDPNTFKPYDATTFLSRETLAAPKEYKVEADAGILVCYVPLDEDLYFTFRKGKAENPAMLETRAFALGATGPADASEVPEDAREIYGDGYAADTTRLVANIELDAALSMAQTNARRVAQQKRHGLADDLLLNYNKRAIDLADESQRLASEGKTVAARSKAWESLAYSSHVHPVTRKNIRDAIVGIIFYLFLTIPFAFFMEKLLVGSNDIRAQIAWQLIIFLCVFAFLRFLHPAYELVRSSYIILLGFLAMALSLMVGTFVTMKFARNVADAYRRSQRRVEAVDVSRMGAAATAFALGLNNLRKRPMRTGLTATTLILITFVMICFTSVRSDIVDIEFPVGEAEYTGLLIRNATMDDVSKSAPPIKEIYGRDQIVSPRAWVGNFALAAQSPELSEFPLLHSVDEDTTREVFANAVLGLSAKEPEVMPILEHFHVLNRWFENESEKVCYLPRALADALLVSEESVKAGEATIELSGTEYTVLGIFDEEAFDNLLDLDGQSMMPLDIRFAASPDRIGGDVSPDASAQEVPEDLPRLPAAQVVITPNGATPSGKPTIASIAVAIKGASYADARAIIDSHLERSGQANYYAIDGNAFFGGRMRLGTLEGIIDLILPIIIAALTVLNTMYGSVYERKSELYVFSAVGLAPNHIRWLFFAEAMVYAVVGAVGGYLLAQGIGALLKVLGLTAGLTFNYSSLSAVFVSVVIMKVVFWSALLPARVASQLAAPAESMTRRRATSQEDAIDLELPFIFSTHDRVAVVPYLVDWFENFGEGSSGDFFCSPPQAGTRDDGQGGVEPYVRTTTWLRPYDLGVSQVVEMVVRHDPETDDNVAIVTMKRQSGDRASWERCNHRFIGHIRKRFLTWRGVGEEDRGHLLGRGRELLDPTRGGEA